MFVNRKLGVMVFMLIIVVKFRVVCMGSDWVKSE